MVRLLRNVIGMSKEPLNAYLRLNQSLPLKKKKKKVTTMGRHTWEQLLKIIIEVITVKPSLAFQWQRVRVMLWRSICLGIVSLPDVAQSKITLRH